MTYYGWKIGDNADVESVEFFSGTDAAQLEDLRRIEGTSRDYNFS